MNEAAIRELLRVSARTTFTFFLLAFTGNALRDLWAGTLSSWLARQRDWFLLGIALSHTVHLAGIIALLRLMGWSNLHVGTAIGGGAVYLLIYALAVNALVRVKRGRETFAIGGPRFEAVALYLLWVVFAVAFVPRSISGWPTYSLLSIAAFAGLVLRIACLVRHRKTMAARAGA